MDLEKSGVKFTVVDTLTKVYSYSYSDCVIAEEKVADSALHPLPRSPINGDSISGNQDRKKKRFSGEIDEFSWSDVVLGDE